MVSFGGEASIWNFLEGHHIVFGEIIEIDDREVVIYVADYFNVATTDETGQSMSGLIRIICGSDQGGYWTSWCSPHHLNEGDYVLASLLENDSGFLAIYEIFKVESLDYQTFYAETQIRAGSIALTDFIRNRGAYEYRWNWRRLYRQNVQDQSGFLVIYTETTVMIGEIIDIIDDEVMVNIADYIAGEATVEQTFDVITYGIRELEDFQIGDYIAVSTNIPQRSFGRRISINARNIFRIDSLDYQTLNAQSATGDSSLSALYTDYINHRGRYQYIVDFGTFDMDVAYQSITRLQGSEEILIYEYRDLIRKRIQSVEDDSGLMIAMLIIGGAGIVVRSRFTKKRHRNS